MGTTVEKLTKILETKEAIRTAINNKGGTLTESDTFSSYSSAIDSLPSGGGGSLKTLLDATQSSAYLFYQYQGTSVDGLISYSDTANVTSMNSMYSMCNNLTAIPELDTSNVTTMKNMFEYSGKLTTIPNLDTSKVTNMFAMFAECSGLTSIPELNTSNVTDMHYFVRHCSRLTSIPRLDVSKCIEFSEAFDGCRSLTSIGMYGFRYTISITSTALEHDAIVAFLNQAGTANNSSQKIYMGSAKLALLSDQEKAIATNKGWTLA